MANNSESTRMVVGPKAAIGWAGRPWAEVVAAAESGIDGLALTSTAEMRATTDSQLDEAYKRGAIYDHLILEPGHFALRELKDHRVTANGIAIISLQNW